MLIAVDIGNSSINIGYFLNLGLLIQKVATHPLLSDNEYSEIMSDFLRQNHIAKKGISCIISSVVASHTAVLINAVERLQVDKENILVVSHKMAAGLNLKVKMPEELGADRLANAVGAYAVYNQAVAVVDFGSATTITVVGKNADLIGGSIMPGIGLMNDVLAERTSKLARVFLEKPEAALGQDTIGCVRSGLMIGTAGAVERILEEIERETGYRFRVIVTGGHAHLVEPFIKRPHEVNLMLTLEGLRVIYAKNRTA
jgi:type III pantothenate kinase